jgi:hypothetical protein
VDPGPHEPAELEALLARLLGDAALRETLGGLARRHVLAHHDLSDGARALARFLREVHAQKPQLLARLGEERLDEGTRLGAFVSEVRSAARELGLVSVRLGLEPLLADLARGRP